MSLSIPYKEFTIGDTINGITGALSLPLFKKLDPDHIPLHESSANNTTYLAKQIYSEETFSELVETAAQAEGSGWGASFSASVKYLSSKKMNEHSLMFTVGLSKTLREKKLHDYGLLELTDQAKKDIANLSPVDFQNKYGSHVVIGYLTGGTYLGSLKATTKSISEKSKLNAELSASYKGIGSGSFSASFGRALETSKVTCTIDIDAMASGQPLHKYEVSALDEMNKIAEAFSKDLDEKGGDPLIGRLESIWRIPSVINSITSTPPKFIDGTMYKILRQLYQDCLYVRESASIALNNTDYIGLAAQAKLSDVHNHWLDVLLTLERYSLEELSRLDPRTPPLFDYMQSMRVALQTIKSIEGDWETKTATFNVVYAVDQAFPVWSSSNNGLFKLRLENIRPPYTWEITLNHGSSGGKPQYRLTMSYAEDGTLSVMYKDILSGSPYIGGKSMKFSGIQSSVRAIAAHAGQSNWDSLYLDVTFA